jgi:hypothetical protein
MGFSLSGLNFARKNGRQAEARPTRSHFAPRFLSVLNACVSFTCFNSIEVCA